MARAGEEPRGGMGFAPTQWTWVRWARDGVSGRAEAALARLCEVYWYPIYAQVRRFGHDHHAAQDLTQGFFQSLLGRGGLKSVDPARGRFRTFLLTCLRHYLIQERERGEAQRRGGGVEMVSWDTLEAEHRYAGEPVDERTPDQLFARHWAESLVERARARLAAEMADRRNPELWSALQPFLTRDVVPGDYAGLSERLGVGEGAIRTAVARLRARFGGLLRAELAATVSDPRDVDDELRQLMVVLAEG